MKQTMLLKLAPTEEQQSQETLANASISRSCYYDERHWVNCPPSTSSLKGVGCYFSEDVVRAVHVGIDERAELATEHAPLDTPPHVVIVMPNPFSIKKAAFARVAFFAAVNAYEQGTPDPKELVHMTIKNECKRYGLSAGTMGAALTYCAEKIGALARQDIQVRHPTSGKIVATETYIGLTSLTSQPNLYAVAKERKKANRKKACTAPLISCKGCNSAEPASTA